MTNNEIMIAISKSNDKMKDIYLWVQNNSITVEQFYMAVAFYIAIIKNDM